MEALLEYVHIAYAQSVLINKISASELRRKVIKGALLVGEVPLCHVTTRRGSAE